MIVVLSTPLSPWRGVGGEALRFRLFLFIWYGRSVEFFYEVVAGNFKFANITIR